MKKAEKTKEILILDDDLHGYCVWQAKNHRRITSNIILVWYQILALGITVCCLCNQINFFLYSFGTPSQKKVDIDTTITHKKSKTTHILIENQTNIS